MISLKTFKIVIKAIQKQEQKEADFCDALDRLVDGRFVSQMSTDIHEALMEILKDTFNDEGDWISWWIYEKDFGKRKDMDAHYKDGTEIKLDTAEDLYKFLVKNAKKDN